MQIWDSFVNRNFDQRLLWESNDPEREGFLLDAMILQLKMDGDVFEGKTAFYDHDQRQLVTRTRWLGL